MTEPYRALPERLDAGLENSLLSSFENMNLDDNISDEKFEDASTEVINDADLSESSAMDCSSFSKNDTVVGNTPQKQENAITVPENSMTAELISAAEIVPISCHPKTVFSNIGSCVKTEFSTEIPPFIECEAENQQVHSNEDFSFGFSSRKEGPVVEATVVDGIKESKVKENRNSISEECQNQHRLPYMKYTHEACSPSSGKFSSDTSINKSASTLSGEDSGKKMSPKRVVLYEGIKSKDNSSFSSKSCSEVLCETQGDKAFNICDGSQNCCENVGEEQSEHMEDESKNSNAKFFVGLVNSDFIDVNVEALLVKPSPSKEKHSKFTSSVSEYSVCDTHINESIREDELPAKNVTQEVKDNCGISMKLQSSTSGNQENKPKADFDFSGDITLDCSKALYSENFPNEEAQAAGSCVLDYFDVKSADCCLTQDSLATSKCSDNESGLTDSGKIEGFKDVKNERDLMGKTGSYEVEPKINAGNGVELTRENKPEAMNLDCNNENLLHGSIEQQIGSTNLQMKAVVLDKCILDCLDVNNKAIDPFETRSLVKNSPQKINSGDCKGGSAENLTTDNQKSKMGVEREVLDKGSSYEAETTFVELNVLSKVLVGNMGENESSTHESSSDDIVLDSKLSASVENLSEKKVDAPGRSNFDYPDMNNPVFDPFKATSSLQNSPQMTSNANCESLSTPHTGIETEKYKVSLQGEMVGERKVDHGNGWEAETKITKSHPISEVEVVKRRESLEKEQISCSNCTIENTVHSSEVNQCCLNNSIVKVVASHSSNDCNGMNDPEFDPFKMRALVENSPKKTKYLGCENVPGYTEGSTGKLTGKETKICDSECNFALETELMESGAIAGNLKKNSVEMLEHNPAVTEEKDSDVFVREINISRQTDQCAVGSKAESSVSKVFTKEDTLHFESSLESTTIPTQSFECNKESKIDNLQSESFIELTNDQHTPRKSLTSIEFDAIATEALLLAQEATPTATHAGKKPCHLSTDIKLLDDCVHVGDTSGMDSSTHEVLDEDLKDEFTNASEFFSNPEELDKLSTYGVVGDKLSLIRNSLYIKFDPLVAGRQSLAPYLAQHIKHDDNSSDKRASGLMSFSPSPPQKKVQAEQDVTLINISVSANDTLTEATHLADTTLLEKDASLSVTVLEGQDQNSTISTTMPMENTQKLLNLTVTGAEKMVSEQEMLEALRNQELAFQDMILRQSKEHAESQKKLQLEDEKVMAALQSAITENNMLKETVKNLHVLMEKIVEKKELIDKEHNMKVLQLENNIKEMRKSHLKQIQQCQDELKSAEDSFFDVVKKYERVREVACSLSLNEEKLKKYIEHLNKDDESKKEAFKAAIQGLEKKYRILEEKYDLEKHSHEQELNKATLMLKRAEVKIVSLVETVDKKTNEIERLTALLDDVTKSFC